MIDDDKPDRHSNPDEVKPIDPNESAQEGIPSVRQRIISADDATTGQSTAAVAPQSQAPPETAPGKPEVTRSESAAMDDTENAAASSGWFHAANGHPHGPVDENALREAIGAERIQRDTLVWRRSMPDWTAAGELPELQEAFAAVPPPLPPSPIAAREVPQFVAPPPLPDSQASEIRTFHSSASPGTATNAASDEAALANFLQQRDATPWSRFWARSVDMIVLGYPAFMLLMVVLGLVTANPALLDWAPDILFSLIFILLSSCSIALSLAIFRTTPGKALYRIRVRPLADKVDDDFWFRRELGVFIYGLGLGIPFVSLITCFLQYRRLARREPTHYDQGLARITQEEIGWARFLAGVVLSVAASLALVALGTIATETGL